MSNILRAFCYLIVVVIVLQSIAEKSRLPLYLVTTCTAVLLQLGVEYECNQPVTTCADVVNVTVK